MKRNKLFYRLFTFICVLVLLISSFTMFVNAEDSPLIDTMGPYNAYTFSKDSSVFNYSSMMTWVKYFELQERAGMLLNRRALAVGVTQVSENNIAKFVPFVLLSGIFSNVTNSNLPVYEILTFGTSNDTNPTTFGPLTTSVSATLGPCYPISGLLSDGSEITGLQTNTMYGQQIKAFLVMESGGLYLNQSLGSTSVNYNAGSSVIFAKRTDSGWVYRDRSEWNAWRAVYGDTSTGSAGVVNSMYENLVDYVSKTDNISVSYDLDIASVFNSIFNAPFLIFGTLTEIEIFGLNIGNTLIGLIVLSIVVFIVWFIFKK